MLDFFQVDKFYRSPALTWHHNGIENCVAITIDEKDLNLAIPYIGQGGSEYLSSLYSNSIVFTANW